jgi:tetratricopeptide (TPR) repeat protein
VNEVPTSNDDSEVARVQGYVLFQQGCYEEARRLYLKAANLSRSDYRPFWDASAACFELGQYESCIAFAHKAFALLEEDDRVMTVKVALRIARTRIHLKNYTEAADTLAPYKDVPDVIDVLELAHKAARHSKSRVKEKQRSALGLPHYKQSL